MHAILVHPQIVPELAQRPRLEAVARVSLRTLLRDRELIAFTLTPALSALGVWAHP